MRFKLTIHWTEVRAWLFATIVFVCTFVVTALLWNYIVSAFILQATKVWHSLFISAVTGAVSVLGQWVWRLLKRGSKGPIHVPVPRIMTDHCRLSCHDLSRHFETFNGSKRVYHTFYMRGGRQYPESEIRFTRKSKGPQTASAEFKAKVKQSQHNHWRYGIALCTEDERVLLFHLDNYQYAVLEVDRTMVCRKLWYRPFDNKWYRLTVTSGGAEDKDKSICCYLNDTLVFEKTFDEWPETFPKFLAWSGEFANHNVVVRDLWVHQGPIYRAPTERKCTEPTQEPVQTANAISRNAVTIYRAYSDAWEGLTRVLGDAGFVAGYCDTEDELGDCLKKAKVVIIPGSSTEKRSDVSNRELRLIEKFVNEGGGLLCVGQAWSWASDDYGNKSVEEFPLNKYGKRFGFKIMEEAAEAPDDHSLHQSLKSKISDFRKANWVASAIKVSADEKEVLVRDGRGRIIAALVPHGDGNVIVAGHEAMLAKNDQLFKALIALLGNRGREDKRHREGKGDAP